MGEAVIKCHGIMLKPCQAEKTDENHMVFIERIEDEYYIRVEHDMTKQHFILVFASKYAFRNYLLLDTLQDFFSGSIYL